MDMTDASGSNTSDGDFSSAEAMRTCYYCTNPSATRDILPLKRCDYCRKSKCQFCTLRFPLIKLKKNMPKEVRPNSRMCVQCFSSFDKQSSSSNLAKRKSEGFNSSRSGDATSDSDLDPNGLRRLHNDSFDEAMVPSSLRSSGSMHRHKSDPVLPSRTTGYTLSPVSSTSLWLSLFAASLMVVAVLADELSRTYRLVVVIATYTIFLILHPFTSSRQLGTSTEVQPVLAQKSSRPKSRSMQKREMPPDLKQKGKELLDTIHWYRANPSMWKTVRTSSIGVVSEMTENKLPVPLFCLEMFVPKMTPKRFLEFVDSKQPKDRGLWDANVSYFDIVERFQDDPNAYVVLNQQKSFLGGLVAPRDFCCFYVRDDSMIVYSSIEHKSCPPNPNATRGVLHMSAFHCEDATSDDGTKGLILQYYLQVDIKGSLSPKLLYNGIIDNMEKMGKVFQKADKVFT